MLPVRARSVTTDDIDVLVTLYRSLEDEMTPLSHLWPLADGLAEPLDDAFRGIIDDPATVAVIGEIDDVALGFCVARVEPMHPQAEGRQIGSIRLIFVDHPAREVGVGEAMLASVLTELRSRGVRTFDAHVLPGHRLVKNFFEAGGFKARSIVMSRYEDV
ncbi:MAG: GNAT family N-acetyltransferase [Acidimicrobiia bacterium]